MCVSSDGFAQAATTPPALLRFACASQRPTGKAAKPLVAAAATPGAGSSGSSAAGAGASAAAAAAAPAAAAAVATPSERASVFWCERSGMASSGTLTAKQEKIIAALADAYAAADESGGVQAREIAAASAVTTAEEKVATEAAKAAKK